MNWEAFGVLAETAGAIAVVASLIYLARQTSMNSKAALAQTAREVDLYIGNLHLEVARDPELRALIDKTLHSDPVELTDAEWFAFRTYTVALFMPFHAQYIHSQLRVGPSEHGDLYLAIAKSLISTFPAWKAVWEQEQQRRSYLPGFFDAVNNYQLPADYSVYVNRSPFQQPQASRAEPANDV